MRLVKEEYHARLLKIADLGQLLEKLRQHPQQKRAVHRRAADKTLGGEDVYISAPIRVGAHPVLYVQRRLAEKCLAALVLKGEQRPLYSADACRGNIAVECGVLCAVLPHKLYHRAQILQVDKQQIVVVRHAEHNVQHALLNLRQPEQPRQQHRSHLRHRHAHGYAVLAENIPEAGGVGAVFKAVKPEALYARAHIGTVLAAAAHTRQIALYVRHEHRHAHVRERLRHHLHGDGLAGAGRAGDEPVAVCHLRQQIKVYVRLREKNFPVFVHVELPPGRLFLRGSSFIS